jgi:hypothetical protein
MVTRFANQRQQQQAGTSASMNRIPRNASSNYQRHGALREHSMVTQGPNNGVAPSSRLIDGSMYGAGTVHNHNVHNYYHPQNVHTMVGAAPSPYNYRNHQQHEHEQGRRDVHMVPVPVDTTYMHDIGSLGGAYRIVPPTIAAGPRMSGHGMALGQMEDSGNNVYMTPSPVAAIPSHSYYHQPQAQHHLQQVYAQPVVPAAAVAASAAYSFPQSSGAPPIPNVATNSVRQPRSATPRVSMVDGLTSMFRI